METPTALVGFREWIFSEKAGALGLFAASAEFAFGTIIQRTMDNPAHVRLHYGKPWPGRRLLPDTAVPYAEAHFRRL